MATWPISVAKARFSEFLRMAQKEPQIITVRGVPKAEAISIAEYLRLGGKREDLEPNAPTRRKRARSSE